MSALRGRLTAAGEPAAHGEVALLAGEPPELVALAETDADGAFELGAGGPGLLAGRALSGRVGLVTRALEEGEQDLALDVAGPFEPLRIEVRTPGGQPHPARLEAFLDPESEGERELLTQTAPGVGRSHFAGLALPEPITTVALQHGTWRIAATFVIYERPMTIEPDYRNYATARALVDGVELPGDPWSGFELAIDRATTLVLELRELRDDEL